MERSRRSGERVGRGGRLEEDGREGAKGGPRAANHGGPTEAGRRTYARRGDRTAAVRQAPSKPSRTLAAFAPRPEVSEWEMMEMPVHL